ncbi:MAG: hypothetical protein UW80_C0016G0021, partial [Microgenomates group bacterium GW2011_GWC1_44_9]
MVDALALGASGATHGGSSPLLGTIENFLNSFSNLPDLTSYFWVQADRFRHLWF